MTSTNDYVNSLIWIFHNNGCKTSKNLPTFEILQELINEEFNEFWNVPENRIGNEKKGTYEKGVCFLGGKKILTIPRDRLNKFKCEKILGYLKYSEDVINIIMACLLNGIDTINAIINILNAQHVNVSPEFVNLVKENWIKILDEIAAQKKLPTKLYTVWVITTLIKRIEYIKNPWNAQKCSYYYIKESTGEIVYTLKKRFLCTKDVVIARAYGKNKDNDEIHSLGYVIGENENKKLYHKLFELLKSRGLQEVDSISLDKDHKTVVKAFKEIYKPTKLLKLKL